MATDTEDRSARPDYGIELVDDLPPKPKRKGGGGGRTSVYDKLLPQVAAHGSPVDDEGNGGGRWVRLAVFHTRYGAQTAANSLRKGDRNVTVPGNLDDWDFVGRRSEDSDESYLFARYNAEAIEYVPEDESDDESDADEDAPESDVSDADEVELDDDAEVEDDDEDIFEVDE